MFKTVLTQIPFIFIRPRQYFCDVIGNNPFKLKDLVYFALVLFSILTILHVFESKIFNRYGSGLEIGVYLFAFVLGLVGSLIFRTYFLTVILNKSGSEVEYKKIGMITAVAMISNLIMILISIIIRTSDYNTLMEIILRIWNLMLILIGIVSIYKIKWTKGVILLILMFGFEMMFKYIIGGVRL